MVVQANQTSSFRSLLDAHCTPEAITRFNWEEMLATFQQAYGHPTSRRLLRMKMKGSNCLAIRWI